MSEDLSDCVDLVVVDDDEILLELIERQARKGSYRLQCFSNPLEALDYLRQSSPRVLVLDQRMPQLDGIELLRALAGTGQRERLATYLSSAADLPAEMLSEAALLGAQPLAKDHWRSRTALAQLMTT